jgi:hypothetical protein
MRWAVIVSDEPVFIISDNPVMFIHPSLTFRGLNDPDTGVIFPLSPTRILSMDHRCGEPDAQFYPIKHNPASVNGLILRNSVDHMFSPRHPDSVCAEILADAECTGFPVAWRGNTTL